MSASGVADGEAPPWVLVAGDFVRTGGMDAANHALASHLAGAGRETHLVAHRVDPALADLPNVVVHRVPRPLGSHLLGFPLLDRAGRRVARLVRGRGAHVVANGGNCRAGRVAWLHYVHAAHEAEIAGRPLRRLIDRFNRWKALRDERAVVARARRVIANSDLTAAHAVELLGADPDAVRTVCYGIEPHVFRPATDEERASARAALGIDADRPAVLFVGALGDRRKGFDTLFAAWAALCADAAWRAVLLVVGAGGELEAWRARAVDGGVGDRIRFLGFRSDVSAVMAACDAIVHPARYEAYGLGVHEALCRGLPALVSARAGVAERLSAALAPLRISDPDDAGEVEARLRAWAADRERYAAAARALSAALRARTWEEMAREIVDFVEEQE